MSKKYVVFILFLAMVGSIVRGGDDPSAGMSPGTKTLLAAAATAGLAGGAAFMQHRQHKKLANLKDRVGKKMTKSQWHKFLWALSALGAAATVKFGYDQYKAQDGGDGSGKTPGARSGAGHRAVPVIGSGGGASSGGGGSKSFTGGSGVSTGGPTVIVHGAPDKKKELLAALRSGDKAQIELEIQAYKDQAEYRLNGFKLTDAHCLGEILAAIRSSLGNKAQLMNLLFSRLTIDESLADLFKREETTFVTPTDLLDAFFVNQYRSAMQFSLFVKFGLITDFDFSSFLYQKMRSDSKAAIDLIIFWPKIDGKLHKDDKVVTDFYDGVNAWIAGFVFTNKQNMAHWVLAQEEISVEDRYLAVKCLRSLWYIPDGDDLVPAKKIEYLLAEKPELLSQFYNDFNKELRQKELSPEELRVYNELCDAIIAGDLSSEPANLNFVLVNYRAVRSVGGTSIFFNPFELAILYERSRYVQNFLNKKMVLLAKHIQPSSSTPQSTLGFAVFHKKQELSHDNSAWEAIINNLTVAISKEAPLLLNCYPVRGNSLSDVLCQLWRQECYALFFKISSVPGAVIDHADVLLEVYRSYAPKDKSNLIYYLAQFRDYKQIVKAVIPRCNGEYKTFLQSLAADDYDINSDPILLASAP